MTSDSLFEDVIAAREMRRQIINRELDVSYGSKTVFCPICHNRVSDHNSRIYWRGEVPNGASLPCFRRGEWDKYNLHIMSTPLQESEVTLIP